MADSTSRPRAAKPQERLTMNRNSVLQADDAGLVVPAERCGFVPPTPGFAPCTRDKGHDGPCAHPSAILNGCMVPDPLTLTQRIVRRLFPRNWCETPELAKEIAQRECINTRIFAELSVLDRIRILLTGRCLVDVRIAGEQPIGANATNSTFSVMPPRWMEDWA